MLEVEDTAAEVTFERLLDYTEFDLLPRQLVFGRLGSQPYLRHCVEAPLQRAWRYAEKMRSRGPCAPGPAQSLNYFFFRDPNLNHG